MLNKICDSSANAIKCEIEDGFAMKYRTLAQVAVFILMYALREQLAKTARCIELILKAVLISDIDLEFTAESLGI